LVKKFFSWVALALLILSFGFAFWNLDILLRVWKAAQSGTISRQGLRSEIVAFDFGMRSPRPAVKTKISSADGMTQMHVSEGEFIMGRGTKTTHPRRFKHPVYLDAFWMDQVEVTNAMYKKCVEAGACPLPVLRLNPYYGKWAYRDHPVVYMNWFTAKVYCEWAGRRLPTEAEWEKAARGTDTRTYPWGEEYPNPSLVNFQEARIGEPISAYRYPLGASPYGVLNMSGNVREWVADWFDDNYYKYSPYKNPTGPEAGIERAMRSGAYDARYNGIETYQRFKHEPDSAGLSRGFRCAESAE
jgi:formylglycine-generating enzyme required for sulfatase activity